MFVYKLLPKKIYFILNKQINVLISDDPLINLEGIEIELNWFLVDQEKEKTKAAEET